MGKRYTVYKFLYFKDNFSGGKYDKMEKDFIVVFTLIRLHMRTEEEGRWEF